MDERIVTNHELEADAFEKRLDQILLMSILDKLMLKKILKYL